MDRWLDFRHRRLIVAASEAGIAAGFAWYVAGLLLPSDAPIYAPISAVVVLGAGYVRRLERVRAMLSGMVLAIAISEIGVRVLGTGAIQIGLLTAAAVMAAHLLLDDLLAVVYAGLNAAVLVALGGEGWVPQRALEAIVGAGTAYAMVYLILPPRPESWIRSAISDQISTARDNLSTVADALRAADTDVALRANRDSDQIDRGVDSLTDTFVFSREVSRFSPWRRRRRPEVEHLLNRSVDLRQVLRYNTTLVRIASRLAATTSSPQNRLADAIDAESKALAGVDRLVAEKSDGSAREALDEIEALNQQAVGLAEGIDEGDSLQVASAAALRIVAEELGAFVGVLERELEDTHLAGRHVF